MLELLFWTLKFVAVLVVLGGLFLIGRVAVSHWLMTRRQRAFYGRTVRIDRRDQWGREDD